MMKLLWDRMENWLKVHAPDVLVDLNQGASELEISGLETAVGYELPSDLKESLRIHNGQSGDSQWLIAGWELLSTARILEEWNVWKGLYDKESFKEWDVKSQEGVANVWWQPAWIPLTYNGCGDHHCLDLAPANGGKNGQIITMWHDSEVREVLAKNYTQWFEHLVRTFELNDAEYVFESGDFEFDAAQK
ncbi:SMI1/KNR4 family protein [Paenibacillus sp. N3.4]|uniref:SMI1/KNR4 family protein n=1 Tax=Paenibacillus sp. N3.4 TaxID=2603222 RepID=UPI0011CA8B49|nr:SMI1/KNR4 family protein [Paenibacillus sp. N3.4]TXK74614.1 molybdenum cofactor biosynthesis protein MoeA [Paenibacillus sp. N3.4]